MSWFDIVMTMMALASVVIMGAVGFVLFIFAFFVFVRMLGIAWRNS